MAINCQDCKDSRSTCGTTLSSACVFFTGELPEFFVKTNICSTININDVFKQFGEKIDFLLDINDLSGLDKKCLGYYFSTINPKKLHQIEINEICGAKSRLSTLEDTINNFDIGTKNITLDLKCFKSENAACETSTDTYMLISVINILVQELCDLKQRVYDLENP